MKSDKIKILIVDDNENLLALTSRVVASAGYQVLHASCGEECLQLVKKHQPEMILLDVVLPDADGRDLCQQIKADPQLSNPLIMLLSGMKTTASEQADGLDVGADGYIVRPVSLRELKARVNAMVRIIMAERERDQLIEELQEALLEVKRLSGLLPICSSCKKIRDDKGYWNKIEAYIAEHSEAHFSHGICPGCAQGLYPGIDIYDK